MTRAVVGYVSCPFCGNDQATVHREARGKKALYFRCYGGPNGDCGTVQIRYPGGQKWITENMRPLDAEGLQMEEINAAGAVRAEVREVEREVAKRKAANDEQHQQTAAGGIVDRMLSILGGEE